MVYNYIIIEIDKVYGITINNSSFSTDFIYSRLDLCERKPFGSSVTYFIGNNRFLVNTRWVDPGNIDIVKEYYQNHDFNGLYKFLLTFAY
jgi:hypothetical protein